MKASSLISSRSEDGSHQDRSQEQGRARAHSLWTSKRYGAAASPCAAPGGGRGLCACRRLGLRRPPPRRVPLGRSLAVRVVLFLSRPRSNAPCRPRLRGRPGVARPRRRVCKGEGGGGGSCRSFAAVRLSRSALAVLLPASALKRLRRVASQPGQSSVWPSLGHFPLLPFFGIKNRFFPQRERNGFCSEQLTFREQVGEKRDMLILQTPSACSKTVHKKSL